MVNLASSVLDAFGALTPEDPPPLRDLDGAFLRDAAAVVLILIDGLGQGQLDRAAGAGMAPRLVRLNRERPATITSVFPSSTVCALGSLDTARPPGAHGLVAYQHWVEEFGVVAQMLRWGPAAENRSFADAPTLADPRDFVPVETVDARLAARGVARYLVQHAIFRSSPLVRMLSPQASYVPYLSTSSAAVLTARLLRQRPWESRAFVFVYWPALDTVSHFVGTTGGEHDAELHAIDELLVGPLIEGFGGDVAFLLTADHGHVDLDVAEAVRFEDHPELLEMLRYPPAGEHRAALLAAREGQVDRVRRYCAERFPEAIGMDADDALACGLYGSPVDRRARQRIGDHILIATGRQQFWYTFSTSDLGPHRASHGALSPEEMRVPLLAWRA